MPIYDAYAPFYDGSGQIRFAILMNQYLRELLERHPVAGRRALDLACGTGTLALMLSDEGWEVVGLDLSEPMLAQARAKAINVETPGRVTFVRGDMRDILATNDQRPTTNERTDTARRRDGETATHENDHSVAPSPRRPVAPSERSSFDLVTCVYDTLNYLLTEEDLAACFSGVAGALAPGGLFVADMNTRHFLEHDWGACEVLEQPGFVQISQSAFEPATACSTMVVTGLAGDDEQGYRRFDETHVERAYAPETIAGLLEAAGLHVEGVYDCFTFQPVAERTQRIAWIARKPVLSYEC